MGLECMKEVMNEPGVGSCVSHMCAFGMQSKDERGVGFVYKPTKFISNSVSVIQELSKYRCPGGHRHVQLLNGRAHNAAI